MYKSYKSQISEAMKKEIDFLAKDIATRFHKDFTNLKHLTSPEDDIVTIVFSISLGFRHSFNDNHYKIEISVGETLFHYLAEIKTVDPTERQLESLEQYFEDKIDENYHVICDRVKANKSYLREYF